MTYTVDGLASDIRRTLGEDTSPEERAKCVDLVKKALNDQAFLAAVFGPERRKPREVLYEDPDKGFCICAHVYASSAEGKPHDHGSSWAIYGQAEGVTEMTDWRIVKPTEGEEPALVEPHITYELTPGMAHFYDVGAVHSPKREGPTKLLRVEGQNLDRVKRTPIIALSEVA